VPEEANHDGPPDGWAAGSLAVTVPIPSGWLAGMDVDKPWWRLQGYPRSFPLRDTRYKGIAESTYLPDVRLRNTVTPSTYEARWGDDLQHVLGENGSAIWPGTETVAIEVFGYPPHGGMRAQAFICFHAILDESGLRDPSGLLRTVRRPGEERSSLQRASRAILRAANAHAPQHMFVDGRGAIRWSGSDAATSDDEETLIQRPWSAVHLVPHGAVPAHPHPVQVPTGAPEERLWALTLAHGRSNSSTMFAPSGADGIGFWWGSTWMHCSESGMAAVAARPLAPLVEATMPGDVVDQRGILMEHKGVETWIHQPGLVLALLAMRQRDFLHHKSEALTDPEWMQETQSGAGAPAERLRAAVRRAQEQEVEVATFRNQAWFEEVNGRPEATRLVDACQVALGSRSLLQSIEGELSSMSRITEALAAEARLDEAEVQARRDAQTRDRLDAEERAVERRRSSEERALALIALAVIVPDLVFAFSGVAADAGWRWAVISALASLALLLGAAAVVRKMLTTQR